MHGALRYHHVIVLSDVRISAFWIDFAYQYTIIY
jgi:hypothetical protein